MFSLLVSQLEMKSQLAGLILTQDASLKEQEEGFQR
jgi:hypothetical protein